MSESRSPRVTQNEYLVDFATAFASTMATEGQSVAYSSPPTPLWRQLWPQTPPPPPPPPPVPTIPNTPVATMPNGTPHAQAGAGAWPTPTSANRTRNWSSADDLQAHKNNRPSPMQHPSPVPPGSVRSSQRHRFSKGEPAYVPAFSLTPQQAPTTIKNYGKSTLNEWRAGRHLPVGHNKSYNHGHTHTHRHGHGHGHRHV
jgi:hypothetical protein